MKRSESPRIFLYILAVMALAGASLACASSTPASAPPVLTATPEAAQPVENPTQVMPSEPPATLPPPAVAATEATGPSQTFLGDAVEFKGYAITGLAVQDPAAPGMLYQAKADKKLIAVEIIISDINGDPLPVNPFSLTLVDANGFAYQTALGVIDDELATLSLAAGEKLRGWVAFETPKDARAESIKYAPDIFGEAARVGLLEPPAGRTPIPEPAASAPAPGLPKLGEAAVNFGYSLTATAVQDPAKPGLLYKARQGYRLVSVEIILANTTGDRLSANPMNAYLVDTNGFVYPLVLGGVDDQIAAVDLEQGEKVQGWVAFSIPAEAQPYSIKYAVETFNANQILQTGLTNP